MATTKVSTKQQLLVTDNLSFQSTHRITNLVDPTSPQDAATKAYVDANASGLTIKQPARVATQGAETYTISAGAVTQITGLVVDGVTLTTNDRILIKNSPATSGAGAGANTANTNQAPNGIYYVTGTSGGNLQVARSTDADTSAEVVAGMFIFVTEGTSGADNGYVLITNNPITLNTTTLEFAQFSGAGQIVAGDGLTKTGNTINAVGTTNRIQVNPDSIDISSSYVGQTSIVTLGTVTTGTWSASTIAVDRGGSGRTSATAYMPIVGGTTTTGAHQSVATGSTTGQALLYQGASALPSFAALNVGGGANIVTGTLPAGNGGTGQSSYTIGDILYADAASSLAKLADVATGNALISGGVATAPAWGKIGLTTHVSGTLPIANGGTNGTTNTTAYNNLSPNTTLGDITYRDATNNVRLAGNTTTAKQYLSQTGTGSVSAAPAWATIAGSDITGAALTTGTADANVLISLGGTPSTALLRAASITISWSGQLAVSRGGTGFGTYTVGDLLVADTTTSLAKLADVATGNALISGGVGVAPSYGKIGLTTHVSGTLPVANGGTGQSSYVNGELLIGNTTGNTLTKATLTSGAGIAITNGGGSITIATTGVLTSSNYIVRETPSGSINGTNPTFTLANTPISGKEMIFVNGILQNQGVGNDYTIVTTTITFLTGSIPQSGDVILVTYLT